VAAVGRRSVQRGLALGGLALVGALLLGLRDDVAGGPGAGDGADDERPRASQPPGDLALAARYAPLMRFDRLEPFLPTFAGYTIFRRDAPSPSFPRQVTLRPTFPQITEDNARAIARLFPDGKLPEVPDLTAALVIEYAIWWDWDIQHLYELEHVWSYVGADGRLLYAEASWHGSYFPMLWQGETPRQGDHPVVYSTPGKHAFVPDPYLLTGTVAERENLRRTNLNRAGTGGLLLKEELFKGRFAKDAVRDALANGYLKERAFDPSFDFSRAVQPDEAMLVPWPALYEWIPRRIDRVLWDIGEWRFR
jgi:hypothetical protein